LQAVVALGSFAWAAALRALNSNGFGVPSPRPRFSHGREVLVDGLWLLGCYHPSQQNTFTGRLTATMFEEVFGRAAELVALRHG
jgi:uracil-DNA glycosylase